MSTIRSVLFFISLLQCALKWPVVCDIRLIQGVNSNMEELKQIIYMFNEDSSKICFNVRTAQWTYATNMTDRNKKIMINEQTRKANYDKLSWRKVVKYDWQLMNDTNLKRQIKFIIISSRASLSDEKYNEIYYLISEMKDIYNKIRICPFDDGFDEKCTLQLEPDIKNIMMHSRNPDELLHVWNEWHNKVGPPMKNKFMRYVQLANQAARMTGFADAGEQMYSLYETENIEYELEDTWRTIQPLYKELFTYVRKKIISRYGPDVVRPDGPIPAHLFGNIWAQDWSNLKDLVLPYPFAEKLDITDKMVQSGFNALRIFQIAEEFYTSLGLKPMPPEFWRYSMLERPKKKTAQCTTSAWDFCNGIDFRIKQCTEINTESFVSAHHEMAHIQYYLHYVNQPYLFRDGANPGFHEGIANAIGLSIFNPSHFRRIGWYKNGTDNYETNINFLMIKALEKLSYAPFAYLVDKWRCQIFREGVENMNSAWWDLRLRYQGVIPPSPRTEQHLDAVAKRHIPADMPYMRYYVALLLEFQIFESLCSAAKHRGQLHSCDIYRSTSAGQILEDALQLGKSKHWKDVLKILTQGKTDRLSSHSILKYFEPLHAWLKIQNVKEPLIGWNSSLEDTYLYHPVVRSTASILSFKSILYTVGFSFLLINII
ncbi:angiotensin-converting enzyme [Agrilus planipennis]|uniref:Angiotensin-converting enzyme n=1 Tax=Agrilus planipennis TaxID=224129 RepID=A0A1W4XAY2_AGRPL|nr:angiotensin-converting enzyme [Agrilus planipennis]